MAESSGRTFASWLEVWRGALRHPSWARLVVFACGWVLAPDACSVTSALVASGMAGRDHHEAWHRLFSRRAWCPDELGRRLFERVLGWAEGPLEVVVDDTLAHHKGPKVFGLGRHLDAVRSTRRQKTFAFGHVWVVLAIRVKLPFAERAWALPLLFRLYRGQKDNEAHGQAHRKKTELAREMLEVFLTWTPRPVRVLVDLGYSNDTLQRDLDSRVTVVGTMRPDAALTALPSEAERKKTGRRRRCGQRLPRPEDLARDARVPWLPLEVTLYGKRTVMLAKAFHAQWYRACGTRLLHVVVVKMQTGSMPWRVFFSTDPDMPAADILEAYAGRWSLEVTFRDLKQHLGFGRPPVRLRLAVERLAPFAGLVFTALALWAAEQPLESLQAPMPLRPWYRTKRGLAIEDLLRAVRHDLRGGLPVFDLGRTFDNLRKTDHSPKSRGRPPKLRAA